MSTSDENEPMSSRNLSDLFDDAFKLFNNLQKTVEPTNSLKVQLDVKKCMKMFEEATKLVSLADMFSSNEEFDEIPTEHMKYFLLPALLGTLATKLTDRDNRLHNLKVSEVYFYDFLHRIKDYGLTNVTIPKPKLTGEETSNITSKSNTQMIEEMVHTRQSKLQRYKEQKELQEQLEILQISMDNENIDEESKRKYFHTLIKSYAMQAVDEINSLAQEKEILAQMAATSGTDGASNKREPPPVSKLAPIIITKNAAQKAVFGMGYPSLPVMTVEEFYEKKIADGEWSVAGPGQTTAAGRSLQDMTAADGAAAEDPEELKKEQDIENDDEEYLAKARAMDEYKDDHKRGWGNRYNRS